MTWSVSPAVGTISSAGLYTAPATLSSPQTVTVTATSVADTSKTATASVTCIVLLVQITVSPSTASLAPSGTQQFTATVTGMTSTAVMWSLSPAVGTISSGGLYTAPATLSSPQTVTVTATSVADTSKTATASVTVVPLVQITVSPSTASLALSGTQQFTATVTGMTSTAVMWSLSPAVGTISSGGLYTAPATLSGPQTVTVTATGTANAKNQATATVTITPPVTVSLTPTAATMLPAQGQTFTATVGGTTNTGVTWSIAPATGTISSSGLYTTPPTILSTSSVMVTTTSVADATKSASATVTLIPPVQITTSSLPGGTVGTAYSATLAATGGVASYTWSLASGQLPPGTSISTSTGAISGTPTTAGSYNVTMKVTDAAGYQATAALAIAIAAASCAGCPGLGITTTSLPPATLGSPYSATLAVTGGTSPYTWSISAGQFPPGLTLSSTAGVISGTPSSIGSYSFTAMVTDSGLPQNTASLALACTITASSGQLKAGGHSSYFTPANSANLLSNPGFESWTSGVPNSWTPSPSNLTVFSQSTTTYHSGSSSLQISGANALRYTGAVTQTLSLPAGTYDLTGWIMTSGLERPH